jgi:hydroxyethylthiazole kinase-like uncharacterized protein yjeF
VTGRPILTAAQMRDAEAAAISAGTPVETLMERAGQAAAEAIRRFAGPMPALVLCGPGNNGGDGYVIARVLAERGVAVRVAAASEPATFAALAARKRWSGPVETMADAMPAPLLIDALFGTGLQRPLDDALAGQLAALAESARTSAAIDLPSGVSSDDGAMLSPVPSFDLTVTFGTLKPAHLLHPAASRMGRVVSADIGVEAESLLSEIARPRLPTPGPDDHKYSRGYVAMLGGDMPGAAALTASAALRSGAGYVRLAANAYVTGVPSAVVQDMGGAGSVFADPRAGAIVLGPGLGRSEKARGLLNQALLAEAALILDADALAIAAGPETFLDARHWPILTPHAGEFARLFGYLSGSKVEQARTAAKASGAVVVFKGPDTVVADPDGRTVISASASHWLATAGSGDVLAGVVAAMRSSGLDAFDAACAGVWLHGRAAQIAGPVLIADDLLAAIPVAVAECL